MKQPWNNGEREREREKAVAMVKLSTSFEISECRVGFFWSQWAVHMSASSVFFIIILFKEMLVLI